MASCKNAIKYEQTECCQYILDFYDFTTDDYKTLKPKRYGLNKCVFG